MTASLIVTALAIVVAVVMVPLLSHWLQSPGARAAAGSGTADALGSFIDVFDPARARADRDLKEHHNAGPVTRTPDDDDDPVRLIAGPDGRPRAVAIRKASPGAGGA